MSEHTELLPELSKVYQALVLASSLDEVKKIHDASKAIAAYARAQDMSLEMQNTAAEMNLRAKRKLGEMIRNIDKHKGGRPPKSSNVSEGSAEASVSDSQLTPRPKLKDLGISKSLSSRCQKIADIPEEEFEEHLAEQKDAGKELTTTTVLRISKKKQSQKEAEQHQQEQEAREDQLQAIADSDGSVVVGDLSELIRDGLKFRCLYANPRWPIQGSEDPDAVSFDALLDMPISHLVEEQAHLHLWVPVPLLMEGLSLLKKWGFEYRDMFTWCQGEVKKDLSVQPQANTRLFWANSHMVLLLGVRGELSFVNTHLPSFLVAKRGKYGSVPEQVQFMVEEASPGPRLELFATQPHKDWYVWGPALDY